MGVTSSSGFHEPFRRQAAPPALATLALCLLCLGCTLGQGRAVGLRSLVDRASADLSRTGQAEARVEFRSSHDPSGRFSVVVFPSRETSPGELIEAGLPRTETERVYRELGYVDVGRGHMLVVLFPGRRTTFTGLDTRRTIVDEPFVCSGVEQCTVVLARDARGVRIAELRGR